MTEGTLGPLVAPRCAGVQHERVLELLLEGPPGRMTFRRAGTHRRPAPGSRWSAAAVFELDERLGKGQLALRVDQQLSWERAARSATSEA